MHIYILSTFYLFLLCTGFLSRAVNIPPRGCANRCYRAKGKAFADCRYRSAPVTGCELQRCVFDPNRSSLGWKCGPSRTTVPTVMPTLTVVSTETPRTSTVASPSSSLASVTPILLPSLASFPPSSSAAATSVVPPNPRWCRNRCYRAKSPAFHDCRKRKAPVPGCELRRCSFSASRAEPGWICAPVLSTTQPSSSSTASVSSPVSPQTTSVPSVTSSESPRSTSLVSSSPFLSTFLPSSSTSTSLPPSASVTPTSSVTSSISTTVSASMTMVISPPTSLVPSRSQTFSPTSSASTSTSLSSRPFVTPRPLPSRTPRHPSPSQSLRPSQSLPPTQISNPSRSSTPSELPTETSIVSPSVGSFEQMTFSKESATDNRIVDSTDGSGQQFSVSYDVQLTQRGVVSLDAIASDASVTCFTNGTVIISLNDDITSGSIQNMYPIGSVLVINNDLFGDCRLAEDVLIPDESEEDAEIRRASTQVNLFRDTFMFIEKVSGSPTFSIIEGTSTTYFALFDRFHLEIFPQQSRSSFLVAHQFLKPVERVEFERTFSGPIDVTTKLKLTYDVDFVSFVADFDLTTVNIELKLKTQWTISTTIEAKFKALSDSFRRTFPFVTQALLGIPSVDFFTRAIGIKIPSFKVGAYFEAPFLMKGGVSLRAPGKAGVTLEYKTATKETTYYARGNYLNIAFGSEPSVITPGSTGFQSPTLSFDDQLEAEVNVFLGVVPSLSIYIPMLQARAGIDVGLVTTVKASLTTPFPPDDDTGLLAFGICDQCHMIVGDAKFEASEPFAIAILGVDFTISFFRFEKRVNLRKVYRTQADDSFKLSSQTIAKYCGFENEDYTTCGDACCQNDVEECDASGAEKKCSSSPSPSPSTPPPTPCPQCDGGAYTDPHLRTFDGLYYNCQAIGEFVMVKSVSKQLDIHALFIGRDTKGTVTKGLVVNLRNAPRVQISIALTNNSSSTTISSCPLQMFVDGEYQDILNGRNLGSKISVIVSTGTIQINLSNGIKVSFRVYNSRSFGCYMERLDFHVPIEFITGGNIVGLLGNPNRDPYDDWMKFDGSAIVITSSTDLYFEEAYNYCTGNWCIRNQSESLFTFSNGSSFSDFNQCDLPYGGRPTFSGASEALINLCGSDIACLIDGLAGDISDAQNALEVQSQLEREIGSSSSFRFEPSSLEAGATENVLVTMDVRQEPANARNGLSRFVVYKVDKSDGSITGPVILTLEDNGRQSAGDNASEDLIFSNFLAVRSSSVGETLSYIAVPVFDEEDRSSPLAITRINAIRIYSTGSGVGKRGDSGGRITVATLEGLALVAQYTWPTDQTDLDTATEFVGEKVGYSCGPDSRNYTQLTTGDDTSSGGTETVIMRIGDALSDGAWKTITNITFAAGWYEGGSSGPATLSTVLRDQNTNEEIDGTALSVAIDPGSQSGCASQLVAEMVVTASENVVLKLSKL